jgi:type II secretory pathway pseudopilin PulG
VIILINERLRLLRLRTGSGRRDGGITLVELLVSMTLLGIVITVVFGLYLSTMRTSDATKNLSNNTKSASNGMNEVARVIRAATDNPVAGNQLNDPAFVAITAESVVVYAYINLDSSAQTPVMIRLSLDANRRLIESRWPSTALSDGNWTFPLPTTTPASTRVLANTVSPHVTGSPWLFTYLLADGTALVLPATGAPTADQLRTIAAVQVTLTVQASLTDATRSVTLLNTVGVPNLALYRTGT